MSIANKKNMSPYQGFQLENLSSNPPTTDGFGPGGGGGGPPGGGPTHGTGGLAYIPGLFSWEGDGEGW